MLRNPTWRTAASVGARPGLLGGLLALLMCLPGVASAARSVQSIDYSAREGDVVVVTLTLSEPVPEPKVFTLDKPARLSLDLPNTSLALSERLKRINIGKVRSVAVAEAEGRSRVVVFLAEPVPHQVRVSGNKLILELGGSSALAAAPSEAPPPLTPGRVAAAPTAQVSSMDFRRGERGEARVILTLTDPATQVDVREESGNVITTFKNVSAPESLLKRYDVLDFATPARFVDVKRSGPDVQVAVTTVGDYERVSYQTGGSFTLELQPLTPERVAQKKREEPTFTGERISLSFQNIDVRALLQIIADVANVNMVVSDQVQGDMAMRLQNVPWDQALDIILRSKGLGKRQEGNVILVAPLQQLAERDKAELEAQKQNRELAPLRSEIIQINYAKAEDLATLIKSKEASQLSDRGSVTTDSRTNTLLVLETREKIAEIRDLVARLDIPVRQVLIESRIVIASDDFSHEIGSKFGFTHITKIGDAIAGTAGHVEAADTIAGVIPVDQAAPTGGGTLLDTLDNRLNFSVPATAAEAGHFGLAILSSDYLVELELSALQKEGRGEVISSPHVVTATGKAAVVEQGQEIPYTVTTALGAGAVAQVQFKKAVLALEVTPFITPDDRVQMDLNVKSDAPSGLVVQGQPAIDTRRVNTSVLVDNGNTVVLGGVYSDDQRNSTDKIPLLGDVPFLGTLFRHKLKTDAKRELLIFVTPKILKEGIRVQ